MRQWCAPIAVLLTVAGAAAPACAPRDEGAIAARQVRRSNRYCADYFLYSDIRQLVDAYEDDAVLLPPGRQAIEGKDAIRAYWSGPTSTSGRS